MDVGQDMATAHMLHVRRLLHILLIGQPTIEISASQSALLLEADLLEGSMSETIRGF